MKSKKPIISSKNNPCKQEREKGYYIGYQEYAIKMMKLPSKQGEVFSCLVDNRNKKSNILRITFEEMRKKSSVNKTTVGDAIKRLREEDLIKTNKSYIMINPKAYFIDNDALYQRALVNYERFTEIDEIELERIKVIY